MSLATRFSFDKGAFEEGTWVSLGDGIKVKVRSPQSAASKALRKKLEAPYAAMTRGGRELPDEVSEDILIKQMAGALIVDWRGVKETDDGPDVPATPAEIERILRAYTYLRDDIGAVIANRETYKSRVTEEDLGN